MVKDRHLQGISFESSGVEIQFILAIKEEDLFDDVIFLNDFVDQL